ncbi:MAG: lipid-A-disaccharide synthase [Candidatus Omnitrophica bacterium]|nr:lipid-A-disaccharide synthase [Candidatus Omnitrophota bacterium]
MEKAPYRFVIISGEESGDMRAASLVRAIRQTMPGASFSGIGGDRSRKESVTTIADIRDLAVIGFVEVLKHYSRIKRIFNLALDHIRTTKPDAVILVDYPGFNLRLAKEIKKLNIKVIYYISPQVWAWKASRVKLIKKVVDRMIVIFPFEKDFYAKHGLAVDFAGNPLIDEVHATKSASSFLKESGLNEKDPVVGLLPGSREKEISRHLPVMIDAARRLHQKKPKVQFLLPQAKSISDDLLRRYMKDVPPTLKISKDFYNALNACDVCAVCSGTATLETGIMGKPMAVIYKTSWVTWFLGRLFVRIPFIALVNIVAGKKVAEEYLQNNATGPKIALELERLLNPEKTRKNHSDLTALRVNLGAPGASRRAAKFVLEALA